MRLDELGVTLTMLRFVLKVNARTQAGGDLNAATAAIADDREPDGADGAAGAPFRAFFGSLLARVLLAFSSQLAHFWGQVLLRWRQ